MAAINTAFFVLLLSAVAYGTEVQSSPKYLVCMIDSTSAERQQIGNFTPEELDPHLCTHIIYNKATVDAETRDIEPKNPHIDLYDSGGLGLYNRTMKLKEANPQLKVILQLCCFRASFWENETMSTDEIISTFIKNAITYMEHHGFDGLYLALFNTAKEFRLLSRIREEFDKHGFLLFTFVGSDDILTDEYLELTPEISRLFDVIMIGKHFKMGVIRTRIFSPLDGLRDVIRDYKERGIAYERMVVSIPTFSVSYRLCTSKETGVAAPMCESGNEGRTQESEMILIHPELMLKIRNSSEGWVLNRDEESGVMYGHSNSYLWTTFEDPVSVRAKVQYALEENLAGVAILAVDMDDSFGYNEEGVKFRLTRAAHEALYGNNNN